MAVAVGLLLSLEEIWESWHQSKQTQLLQEATPLWKLCLDGGEIEERCLYHRPLELQIISVCFFVHDANTRTSLEGYDDDRWLAPTSSRLAVCFRYFSVLAIVHTLMQYVANWLRLARWGCGFC